MRWFQQALQYGNGKNRMPRSLIYSILILVPYIAISLATSQVKPIVPVIRSYTVTSNCSNATMTSGTITAADQNITAPPDTTYKSIGLPVSFLTVGESSVISGDIAPALNRACLYSTLTVGSVVNSVYTCADNGIASCVVTLSPLQ